MGTGQNRRAELVTAQAYAHDETGPFLQLSRLNLEAESKRANRARLLFEHILTVTQDYRAALTLAEHCNDATSEDDDADDGLGFVDF